MSFSQETKNELTRVMPEKKCCELAEISGYLRVAGRIRLAGGGKFEILVVSETPAAARHYKKLLQNYFHIDPVLSVAEKEGPRKGREYILRIGADENSDSILRETGILLVREGRNYLSDGIYDGIVRSKCCRKAYLRGLFLGSGSVSNPEKDYHLEFTVGTEALAQDIRKLVSTFVDLSVRISRRRGKYVVYAKSAQYVSDLLAIMGAYHAVLEIENVRIRKDVMNQTTRIMNCDAANTDRMLDASERQIEAIRRLEENGTLREMPVKLRELAELRLEHPEASLTQLGEMSDPPLKKSGVNSRMARILKIAER